MANVVFLAIFFHLMLSTNRLLADADTGWHIRTGDVILKTLSVPRYDPFSFLAPPLPWIAHAWLPEVIMAIVHRLFGLTGIVVFFSSVIAFVYYVLFRILQTKHDILLTTVIFGLVATSSAPHWLARPHIFSIGFTVATSYLLSNYQYHNKNYLYLLPVIMFFWVNSHAAFIIGFLLMAIYFSGNLLTLLMAQNSRITEARAKAFALGLTLACCLVTSLLNPYGYRILLFPFQLTSERFLMDYIVEYLSPNFHDLMPFRYLLFLSIAILALSRSRLDIIQLMLVLVFTHLALYSVRHILLYAIIVAPILLDQAQLLLEGAKGKWVDFFKERSAAISLADSRSKGYLCTISAVAFVCLLAASGKLDFKFSEKTRPVAAVEFLKNENLKGNMFSNMSFGDYVIYAAWPQYKVFVDGRVDMYGSNLMLEHGEILSLRPTWRSLLDKYNINWVFDRANSPLSLLLLERGDWKLIYSDKVANIFLRNTLENQPVIDKFRNVKPFCARDNGDAPT